LKATALTTLSPIIDGLSWFFRKIVTLSEGNKKLLGIVGSVTIGLFGMLKGIKLLLGPLTMVSNLTGNWITKLTLFNKLQKTIPIQQSITGIGTSAKVAGPNLLKGAAAIAIFSGAMFILGKGLQEIGKSLKVLKEGGWESIAMLGTITVGLSALSVGLGALFPYAVTGAVALGLISGAMFILGKSTQEVGKGLNIMSESFTSMNNINLISLMTIPPLMATIASSTALATTSMLSFAGSMAAVSAIKMISLPIELITKKLEQPIVRKESREVIDYNKLTNSVIEGIRGTVDDIVRGIVEKIEIKPTPVFVSNKKIGEIIFRATKL